MDESALADRVRELLLYNPDTGEFIWRNTRGGRCKAGELAGYRTSDGYIRVGVDGKYYLASRLAFLYMEGRFPHDQLDHINHIRSDNRFCNLREVDGQTNIKNQSLRSNNKSGHMGVHWNKHHKIWAAYIRSNNVMYHLGTFADYDDAVAARKAAEIELGFHVNHGNPLEDSPYEQAEQSVR